MDKGVHAGSVPVFDVVLTCFFVTCAQVSLGVAGEIWGVRQGYFLLLPRVAGEQLILCPGMIFLDEMEMAW